MARAPHPATVAQRREAQMRQVKHAAVQRMEIEEDDSSLVCKHCNDFLGINALWENDLVKVTKCIFKSSLYVISKRHREDDELDVAIEHLHQTVEFAQMLGWPSITHVVMHIGPTKKKSGNSYDGYEHFHSFVIFDPKNNELERKYQSGPSWARDMPVATELWGNVSVIKYARDDYVLGVEEVYRLSRKQRVNGLTPVYFSIVFENGAPKTTQFSI
ncbi:hypothetical protein QHF89_44105 [Polyangium sorediatum]|uniref:Uncharacterized protein n=1 Tax=Polyangium sorediatum TaxID=889274 RepID=A0ABT6P7H7_9BACT|nr:hypothetical protein [Polyangium sorediatum]